MRVKPPAGLKLASGVCFEIFVSPVETNTDGFIRYYFGNKIAFGGDEYGMDFMPAGLKLASGVCFKIS